MPLRPEYRISSPDRASHLCLPGSSLTGSWSGPADVPSYTLPLLLLEGKKKIGSLVFVLPKVCNLIRHESHT